MRIISERSYKKNYKKYSKNSRWEKFVFKNNFNQTGKSSFAYIVSCFINNDKIPAYFYPHQLSGVSKKRRKRISRKIGINYKYINIVELHFDGRSSDMLLEYSKYKDIIDVLNLGTHKDIFGY